MESNRVRIYHKLLQVLDRAREVNLKLEKVKKFQFKSKKIGYVGHVLTSDGVKANPEKIRAVVEMQTPDDTKSLRRFLGMVTYLSKFIPQLSEAAAPLRKSLRKGVPWSWCDKQEEAFDKIKRAICIRIMRGRLERSRENNNTCVIERLLPPYSVDMFRYSETVFYRSIF